MCFCNYFVNLETLYYGVIASKKIHFHCSNDFGRYEELKSVIVYNQQECAGMFFLV